ncbi:amino acid/amide ABC transporter ATP-binding protein 2, HAAT family [Lentibacillus halodurans]|uniref:Amino acid/amide ABC transporter ATP-binding protein 2, HAAT family n=1 Tax=Lentibacillus halodurans TaxID=237679 RepID=A0A1I0Z9K2_9BACI|nr:ABC transporter ATP-binding protein [Lentibacillus halodurans]SFB22315.1 amino acid/amide ABC transporter ATP-binding protein 2, HAAT family [Lentibacillus halodurans]
MLELRGATVNYGNFSAVQQADISVEEGDIVVLLGANGAGKSTTFRAISGLVRLVSGEILFKGDSIDGKSPDKIVQMGIVQCAEDRKLFPQMSVEQNLMMGAYVHRKNKKQIRKSLEEVYELFPILYDKRTNFAHSLSGGQQQMLAIGRALMSKPKVMLLDEPSTGLAPLVVEQMFKSIQQINNNGTTILLAEQNAKVALSIATKGYVYENGSIAVEGKPKELFSNEKVRKAYLGA